MRFSNIPGLLLAGVLALAGCGSAAETARGDGGSAGTESTALAFAGETLDGDQFEGAQLAGKPAVLWFWAPWCPTCRAQAPTVTRLAEAHAGDVSFVGVGGLADVGDIRDYATQVTGPVHLIDPEGEVWRHFGVTAQSSYVVLDADGRVVVEGYLDNDALADRVAELVG